MSLKQELFPKMKIAIVSGADNGFYWLLNDLLTSLEALSLSDKFSLCIYDFGLDETQKSNATSRSHAVVKPGWTVSWPNVRKEFPEHKKSYVTPPFMRDHFPGFDIYIWLDADAYCLNDDALNLLVQGALARGCAAVPEVDRCYPSPLSSRMELFPDHIPFLGTRRKAFDTWHWRRLKHLYGRKIANEFLTLPMFNTGVYALMAHAPHWEAWQRSLKALNVRKPNDVDDQMSFNHAVYTENLDCARLPAWCNWLTNFSTPVLDLEQRRLVEPHPPHTPISIVHLIGRMKKEETSMQGLDGRSFTTKLDYSSIAELLAKTGYND